MKTKPKRPKLQPVYLVGRKLVDPETGEVVGALVAASPWDARRLRDMKLGAEPVRAELRKPRNLTSHKRAHALGQLLADHWPPYAGLPAHEALKRAQVDSGAACDLQAIDLGPLGKVQVKVARSLAFDSMSETEFGELFAGLTRWIDENVVAHFPEEARGEYWLMTGERK